MSNSCQCGCKHQKPKVSPWVKLHGFLHRFFIYFYLSSVLTSKYQRFKERFHEWNEARLDRKYGVETYEVEMERREREGKK